jgi:hypothetical protein
MSWNNKEENVAAKLELQILLSNKDRGLRLIRFCLFDPLKTKRRPLYLKTQSVPLCKHFLSRL